MADPFILHYAPDNASVCVRLELEELGLDYETKLVDRRNNAHKSAPYLVLNPNGLIPTLETPQGAMFETAAILLWLADLTPGAAFPAPDTPARGAALTRLFWLSNTVHPTLRMLFYPQLVAPDHPAPVRATAQARLITLWDQMDADTDHLITQTPSVIGCYLAPMLRWCALYGGQTTWFDLRRWPNLFAFAQSFEGRTAALNAARQEGLGPTPFSHPAYPTPPEGTAT